MYIPIVASFIYLGNVIARYYTDTLDILIRIEKDGEAFGSVRKNILSSTMSNTSKKFVYCCIILTILLYEF